MKSASANWPRIIISDVCESIIDCINKTAPTVSYETPFRMIRTTNIKNGRIDLSDVKHVTKKTYHLWTRRQVPKQGDIILTREAPLGEVGMLRDATNVFLGQRLVSYRADPTKLDNRFLLYAFQEHDLQSQIKSLGSGATVEHMRVPDAKKLMLKLPPLDLQHRIADILFAHDDLFENNIRRIQILEEMAQTIYHEWFVNFRFPDHEKVKIIESSLGKIPEGWEAITLRDITENICRGISPKYDDSSDCIVINQKCIRDNRVNLELARKQSKPVPHNKFIKFGDVLVNSTGIGTLGRIAQFYDPVDNCTVDSHVSIVRPNDRVNLDYFGLSMFGLQQKFENLATGSTGQIELGRDIIANCDFLIPPRNLQNSFSNVVSSLRQNIELLFKINFNLRSSRDLILPKLISGDINVSEIEITAGDMAT